MQKGLVEPLKIIEDVLIERNVEDADCVAEEIAAKLYACILAFGKNRTFIGIAPDVCRLAWMTRKEDE